MNIVTFHQTPTSVQSTRAFLFSDEWGDFHNISLDNISQANSFSQFYNILPGQSIS